MLLCSKQDKTFLKKYFFQSAIIQLDNLKIRNSSSLKTVSLNLSDYLLIVFLTATILKQLNLPQDLYIYHKAHSESFAGIQIQA